MEKVKNLYKKKENPYQYNLNSNLNGEIKRFLENSKNFRTLSGKIYKINKIERKILEKIIKKNGLEKIAKNTSREKLKQLKSEIIVSSATRNIRNKINKILKLQVKIENKIYSKNKFQNINTNKEILSSNNILQVFNKTSKGRKLLEYISKYSSISIEKFASYIENASKNFDVPYKYIVAIIVGESDLSKKRNPFKVNSKGIGQFLPKTFKSLYSRLVWRKKRGKNYLIQGNVLNMFDKKGLKKYANNLKQLNINSLNDRYDPFKAINAIAAYIKYITIKGKGVKGDYGLALARYNIGPFGNVGIKKYLANNPVIEREIHQMYGKNVKITNNRVLYAAKHYYLKYV